MASLQSLAFTDCRKALLLADGLQAQKYSIAVICLDLKEDAGQLIIMLANRSSLHTLHAFLREAFTPPGMGFHQSSRAESVQEDALPFQLSADQQLCAAPQRS